jgi:hypothetical protein
MNNTPYSLRVPTPSTVQQPTTGGAASARPSNQRNVSRDALVAVAGLKDLRIGFGAASLITLRNARGDNDTRAPDDVLHAVADIHAAKAGRSSVDQRDRLLLSIDKGLADLSLRAMDDFALAGIGALVGLKLDPGSEKCHDR